MAPAPVRPSRHTGTLSPLFESTHSHPLPNHSLKHDFFLQITPLQLTDVTANLARTDGSVFFPPLNNLVISSFRSNCKNVYIAGCCFLWVFFHFPLLIIESRRAARCPQEPRRGGRCRLGAAAQGALRGVIDFVHICTALGPRSALPGCAPAQAVSQGEYNTSRLWPI